VSRCRRDRRQRGTTWTSCAALPSLSGLRAATVRAYGRRRRRRRAQPCATGGSDRFGEKNAANTLGLVPRQCRSDVRTRSATRPPVHGNPGPARWRPRRPRDRYSRAGFTRSSGVADPSQDRVASDGRHSQPGHAPPSLHRGPADRTAPPTRALHVASGCAEPWNSSERRGGVVSELLLDAAGRRRSARHTGDPNPTTTATATRASARERRRSLTTSCQACASRWVA
jgi:hypothetical protein